MQEQERKQSVGESDTTVGVVQDPLLGAKFGERYQILSLIGRGATSCVYEAEDLRLSRFVAVKTLHSHLAIDPEIVRRFEQEVKTASILKHAAAVPIHDSGVTKTGQPFLVMELVEGRTLADILKQSPELEWRRAVKLFVQVCACLGAAHEKGIVHRDLKPGNLMIATDMSGQELVRVLDFGIAKVLPVQGETFQRLTQSGEMLGTLLYMSPEQCLDEDLDGRSDVYSLGCLMYETFTGKPPLCGRTAFETMNKHMSDMPEKLSRVRPDLDLPQELEGIVFKSLAKKRKHRYQTIGEVEDALKSSLRTTPNIQVPSTNAASNQVSTNIASMPIVSTVNELATKALQEAQAQKQLGTKIALFFAGSAALTTLGIVLLHGDVASWIFVFILLFFGLAALTPGQELPKIERITFVLLNTQPQTMLIREVNGNSEQSTIFQVTLENNDKVNRSKMQLGVKVHPAGRFWDSLAMASQLEDLASRNIAADVYTDPETKQPVAVMVKDQLFFV